jgi:hypothetical protein
MRFGLVRTDMVVPTGSIEDRRALSAEQAAARVVRALEDRPIVVSNLAAHLGELLTLLAPRLSDALMHRYDRAVPDSRAARGESEQGDEGDHADQDDQAPEQGRG